LAAVAQVEQETQRRHAGATQPQQKQGGSTGGPPPPNSLPARSKSPTLRPDCARCTPRGAPSQPKWVPTIRPASLDSPGSTSVPARAPPHAADSLNPSGFDVQGGLNPSGFGAQSAAGPQATPPLPRPAGAKAALSRAAGSSQAPGWQPSLAAGRDRSRTPAPVPSTSVSVAQQPLHPIAPPSTLLPVQSASYTDFRTPFPPRREVQSQSSGGSKLMRMSGGQL